MEGVGEEGGKEVGEGDADGDVDANCGLLRPVDGRQIAVASLRRCVVSYFMIFLLWQRQQTQRNAVEREGGRGGGKGIG